MNNIATKDNLLFYGLPGMVILIISTLATVSISSHFNDSKLVTAVSFVGSNGTGWLAYLLLQYLLDDLLQISDIMRGKNNAQMQLAAQTFVGAQDDIALCDTIPTAASTESDEVVSKCPIHTAPAPKTDEVISNDPISDDGVLVKEVISNDHLTVPTPISQTQYSHAQMEFEQKVAAEKADRERVIMEYVNRVMAPFVEHDNLIALCEEIHKWCENSEYEPVAIPLKYFSDQKSRLKTIDFKHFVWNIGERMYEKTAYTSTCRATFVKSLFPEALKDNAIDSLRNLTNLPTAGFITLDKPKGSSYAFHVGM